MLKNNGFHNRHSPILRAFSPLSLFSGGAPGAWYDPSDLTTLFQDSAGTTPVTAVEQPVGLMLDKSQGLVASTKGAFFPRTNNSTLTTPAAATSLAFSGDFTIETCVNLSQHPAATAAEFTTKGSGATYDYRFYMTAGGSLVLAAFDTGGTQRAYIASSTISIIGGSTTWLKVTLDVDNGAGSSVAKFYQSSDGVMYAQIGTDRTLAVTYTIRNTASSIVVLGADINGTFSQAMLGKMYRAIFKSGVDGPTVADFNPTLYTGGATFTAPTGQVWTINGSANITPDGNHAFQATSASRPVLSARVNKLLATAALATQSVTTRATAHTLRFEGAGSVTLTGTAIGVYTAGTHSITTTAGTLTLTVLGSVTSADLRETNDGVGVPAYQAVVTSTDYATTGFLPYLKFDGVDDSLSTNSISFTATDKMSVFAGVRKLSDAAAAILAELSAVASTNNGAFYVATPDSPATYGFGLRGTNSINRNASTYTAPITNVLAASFDIAQATPATELSIRINAATPGTIVNGGASDAGTGNFGNYPLYIGRRGGTSLPFNGQLYSMIIVGKAVTAGELSSTETYVNSKTGAYA